MRLEHPSFTPWWIVHRRAGLAGAGLALLLMAFIAAWPPPASAEVPPKPPVASAPTAEAKAARASRSLRPDEDWTSPGLERTHLHPHKPLVMTREDRTTFTRDIVLLQWRPLDPIYLFVLRPKGVAKPPVALYLYSYPQDKERFRNDGFCSRLLRNGYAVVGFESALTGDRYRFRPMREWFVSELPEALASSAHDVPLILNYLATRNDLDMSRVGMFGQGSGGAIAILAAGADPRIKAVDVLNPWGDWPDWMKSSSLIPEAERKNYVTDGFQKNLNPLEPMAWINRLPGRHIRVQFIENDTDMPLVCQNKFVASVPSGVEVKKYTDVLDAFHSLADGRLGLWLGRQLNAKTTGVSAPPP